MFYYLKWITQSRKLLGTNLLPSYRGDVKRIRQKTADICCQSGHPHLHYVRGKWKFRSTLLLPLHWTAQRKTTILHLLNMRLVSVVLTNRNLTVKVGEIQKATIVTTGNPNTTISMQLPMTPKRAREKKVSHRLIAATTKLVF